MFLQVDTQKVHSALVTGGFTVEQADTVIEVMRDIDLSHLATKDDIKDVRAEIKDVRGEVRDVRKELERVEKGIDASIKTAMFDLTKWLMPLILGLYGLIIFKLFM